MGHVAYTLTDLDIAENIEYDKLGRMQYNPLYHFDHGNGFTEEELEYLCKYYEFDGARSIGFALGKTEMVCSNKVHYLKKAGLYEHYKNLNKYW